MARRWTWWVDAALPVGLAGAGLMWFDPQVWALAVGGLFVGLAGSVLGGAAVVTWLAERVSARLQGPRRGPPPVAQEAFETARAMFIAACLGAWPICLHLAGEPIGLVWALPAGEAPAVLLGTGLGVVAMDAWLYWKHRLLHSRALFGFHKAHHAFRDPTAFAAFAVAPVEALLTFWPILLLCFPWAVHWAPVYVGLVVGFVLLNFYLHCGVEVPALERACRALRLNSSVHHNVHHAKVGVHFGEASFVWDRLCGTEDKAAVTAGA
jgi:sterol desaturase/sphingolipid hydroxylase (fatty acid hydroxylase superfamily)